MSLPGIQLWLQNADLVLLSGSTPVGDPNHFDADQDPIFHFDSDPDPDPVVHFDPDPNVHFDADPDPDPSFQIKAQNLEKCSN